LRDLSAFEVFSVGNFNIIRRAAVGFSRLRMAHPQLMPAPKPPSRPLMLDAPQGVCFGQHAPQPLAKLVRIPLVINSRHA
jgi:hypothetical protein